MNPENLKQKIEYGRSKMEFEGKNVVIFVTI